MALSSDVKAYADAALEQGKRAVEQAQHALTDAPSREGKALIDNAKTDLDAFLAAVEPYVAQARQLRHSLVERTEELVGEVRKDPRVAKAYGTAESLAGAVRHTVNDKVVAPAMGIVGRKPGPRSQTAPAPVVTTPAAAPVVTTPAAAQSTPDKPAAKHPAAPATTKSAVKTAAKKTTKTTARKSTSAKTVSRKKPATKSTAEAAGNTAVD